MQTYTYSNSGNQVLPLMMNFTRPTPISEYDIEPLTYNDQTQVSYEMRIVGTRSLKHSSTHVRTGGYKSDKKNEIDDSKSVR